MNDELWKPIEGYEGLYEISTWGRVRSLARTVVTCGGRTWKKKDKILKPVNNGHGYLVITLSKDMTLKTVLIHRLVALAFIPNPCGYPMINHRDEDKKNNRVENLEWCDAAYNVNYGTANARRSYTEKMSARRVDNNIP